MKKYILISALLGFGSVGFSQTSSGTPAQVELTEAIRIYARTNGTYITSIPAEKATSFTPDGEITQEKANLVDPFAMGLSVIDRNQYFKITGTDRFLVVKSLFVLDNELKNKAK